MDRRKGVWLVKRRQRDKAFEIKEHVRVDHDRPAVFRAAVHHAMAHGNRLEVMRFTKPLCCHFEVCRDTVDTLRAKTSSIGLLPAAAARSLGCEPMPSPCPFTSPSRSLVPSVPNSWNLTPDEPALRTRIKSIGNRASGSMAVPWRQCARDRYLPNRLHTDILAWSRPHIFARCAPSTSLRVKSQCEWQATTWNKMPAFSRGLGLRSGFVSKRLRDPQSPRMLFRRRRMPKQPRGLFRLLNMQKTSA
jgi:hypothetical protein